MRVFLSEFVTGGGWYDVDATRPPDSLAAEGRAMRDALAADFAATENVHVDLICDVRYPAPRMDGVTIHAIESAAAERRAIERLAAAAAWTVVIAPEFDGHLLARTRAVEQVGGRLLGPKPATVALCADKQATAVHLEQHGVPVARGVALEPGAAVPDDFAYPAILKPRDGAGSLGVMKLDGPSQRLRLDSTMRLEQFCPGMAVSVACLCDSDRVVPLAPCGQRLGDDFGYLGGWLPLEPALADRARRLAVSAVQSLPNPLGYVGVDLVLGDQVSGAGDVVIEINPRLTTSYVGLRAAVEGNLASTMIAVAEGRAVRVCWKPGVLHFSSSGSVTVSSVRGS